MGSWITLSRQKIQIVIRLQSVGWPREDQRLGDALAGVEDTIGKNDAAIRISRTGDSAGVHQANLRRKAANNDEQVRVYN